ncbi:hypothetical protein C5167_024808 [Papaver somniferum]|uniref:Bowman-Birk serine protease inhibitors family domain-containing protein n=1 Tax=Papaver somniferum TaxID=3469 RepID=A0A4Y7JQN8_PAPSO|nr:hypothetical protein C5167_024808 [Papaver somniferum]
MAKISMFLGFFLLALVAMPAASSASRMILQDDHVNTCPEIVCLGVLCSDIVPNWDPNRVCPEIRCSNGVYTPCCECPKCCPPA